MNKLTLATLAATAFATLAIGMAAPALAAPSGTNGNDTVTVDTYFQYPMTGQTPYGTYQNDNK